jgi:hypothetical protein
MDMEEIQPSIAKPMTCVDVPKSQAQKLKIGQVVTYTVTGKLKGIHEKGMPLKPNEEEKYVVDVEVDEIKGFENNTADVEYQKLKEAQ